MITELMTIEPCALEGTHVRIGTTEEGTLRKHQLNADGTTRDSVYVSITDDECQP